MAKGNMYYDTRNGLVYDAESIELLDRETRSHLKMVPSDGIVIDNHYIQLNSESKDYVFHKVNYEDEPIEDDIKIVNNHHEQQMKIIFEERENARANQHDVNEQIRFGQSTAIDVDYAINENFTDRSAQDAARNEVIRYIRKGFHNENFDYLTAVDLNNAYENGKNSGTVRADYNRKKVKTALLSIVITAMVIAGSIGVKDIVDRLNNSAVMHESNTAISQLSYDERDTKLVNAAYKESKSFMGIVAQNTHRTSDNQNFYFDNIAIARDILKIKAEYRDMALYQVYADMGINRDNPGHHNLDEVIQVVYPECKGFNDYLVNKGFYVFDENNEKVPNKDAWIEYQKKDLITYNNILQEEARSHIEDLYLGGR